VKRKISILITEAKINVGEQFFHNQIMRGTVIYYLKIMSIALSLSPGSQLDILSEISNLAAKASWNDNIAAPVKKDQGQTSRKLNLKNVKRATKNKSLQGVKQKKNDKILSQKLMRDLENWETCSGMY
jgi:hypothetical protein